jgi:glycosyltransferase involved in cell wall biosynthesis
MARHDRRNLLFVTPWLRDGGIERVIQATVPWLARRGYRCEVASWNVSGHLSGRPNPVLATLQAAAVPVRVLRAYGRFKLFQRAVQVAGLALRSRADLIVSYELEGNLVALLARRLLLDRVRVMTQTQNASNIHAEVGTSRAWLRLARRLYPNATMVVPSDSMAADSARFFGLDATRVVTVHNPLAVASIRERSKESCEPPVEVSRPFLVGCGRLVPMKGFYDLLAAFAEVRRERPLGLVILGEGPERANLRDRIQALQIGDDVLMPGFAVNPWSYFARASAFVLSSRYGEASPMVLVEAMACGIPVIASRCEWGPEEILENGEDGLLFDPGDVDTLAQHIRTVLESPSVGSRLVQAATRRAEEFAEEIVMPKMERQIQALLD